MNKVQLVRQIVAMSRREKEVLLDNFSQVENFYKYAQENLEEKVYQDLLTLCRENNILMRKAQEYVASKDDMLLTRLISLILKIIPQLDLESTGEDYDNVTSLLNEKLIEDPSFGAAILEQIAPVAEVPAVQEEQSNLPAERNLIPEKENFQETGTIEANGRTYKIFNGLFLIPLNKNGEETINMSFLAKVFDIFDEMRGKEITPEFIGSASPEERDIKNKSGKLNSTIIDSLKSFYALYKENYSDINIYGIQDRLNKRISAGATTKEELISGLMQSTRPEDQNLLKEIDNLDFFDDIGRDFMSYQLKHYVFNVIGTDLYSKIVQFKNAFYGTDFSQNTDISLAVLFEDVAMGNDVYGPEISQLVKEIIEIGRKKGFSIETLTNQMADFFPIDALRYYDSVHEMVKYYNLERELARLPENDQRLKWFCPSCGRFRQALTSNDEDGVAFKSEGFHPYWVSENGVWKYNIRAHGDQTFTVPDKTQMVLSPEAQELISHPCVDGCLYDELIPNYFAQKITQDDSEKYWDFRPLRLAGVEVQGWGKIKVDDNGEIIDDEDEIVDNKEQNINKSKTIQADKKFIEYLNKKYEEIITALDDNFDKSLVFEDFINFLKLGSMPVIFEGNPEELTGKKKEFNKIAQRDLFDSANRVFKYIRNAVRKNPNAMKELQEIAKETNSDPNIILNLVSTKEFFSLMPPDMPSKSWNRQFQTSVPLKAKIERIEDKSVFADLMHLVYKDNGYKLEILDLFSSPRYKKWKDDMNQYLSKLAINACLNEQVENESFEQFSSRIINDFLKAETIKLPAPLDIKDPKYDEKVKTYYSAPNIQSLEDSVIKDKTQYVSDWQIMGYNAKPEDLAPIFKKLLWNYRSKLRAQESISRDFDIYEGTQSQPDQFNIGRERTFDKLKRDPTQRATRPTTLDIFRNMMQTASGEKHSSEEVNQLFQTQLQIDGYQTSFPVEDYALLLTFKNLRKDRKFDSILSVKKAMKEELLFIKGASGKKGENFDFITNEFSKIYGADATFIGNILTDSDLNENIETIVPQIPAGEGGWYRERYNEYEEKGKGYPALLDTLVKYWTTEEHIGKEILKDALTNQAFLETQMRQAAAILSLDNLVKGTAIHKNYFGIKQIAYLMANAILGSIPERSDVPNIFGYSNIAVSLASQIFQEFPAEFAGVAFKDLFANYNKAGRVRKGRTKDESKKTPQIEPQANSNSWYKESVNKQAQNISAQENMDKPKTVILYSPYDLITAANNFIVYRKKHKGWKTAMPKIFVVPFETFKNMDNLKRFEKNSDFFTLVLTGKQHFALEKAGLLNGRK